MEEETRQDRFNKAVEEKDQEYLDQHDAGRMLAIEGAELPEDPEIPQAIRDGFESGKDSLDTLPTRRNQVFAQPHPLGNIQIITFGSDGTQNSARITLEQASVLVTTLNMWMTTMMQQNWVEAQQMAAAQSQLVIPRS